MRFPTPIIFTSLLLFLAGCYTVPETGRTAISLIPESQLTSMAVASFQKLKEEEKVARDPALNERVQRVGRRIAEVVGDAVPAADWEFVVFADDEMLNAFAMPGGKVGVYTGMFRAARTDDELAVVMGHEIAHVVARHGSERLSQGLLVELLQAGVDKATEDAEEDTRRAIMTAFGLGSTFGYLLPFSRLSEKEADHIGLLYAARSGYDPRAAVTFWQRMDELGKGEPPVYFSTHPSHDRRIAQLNELMPRALGEYREALKRLSGKD